MFSQPQRTIVSRRMPGMLMNAVEMTIMSSFLLHRLIVCCDPYLSSGSTEIVLFAADTSNRVPTNRIMYKTMFFVNQILFKNDNKSFWESLIF